AAGEPARGDDPGARRGDVGLLAPVARRPLARGDRDPAPRLVEVGDGDDALPARQRRDRRIVDRRALGEERGEAPRLARPDAPELARVVALDPGVERAVADLAADQVDQPLAGR